MPAGNGSLGYCELQSGFFFFFWSQCRQLSGLRGSVSDLSETSLNCGKLLHITIWQAVAVGRSSLRQQAVLNTCTVISCVWKSAFFTLPLYWAAALRDDIPSLHYSDSPLLCWICTGGWDPPPPTPIQTAMSGEKGGKSAAFFFFFFSYEPNVLHSSEHCSAVDLSVKKEMPGLVGNGFVTDFLEKIKQIKSAQLHSAAVILLRYFGQFLLWYLLSHLQPIVDLKRPQM